ncbi:hypothetical protein CHH78_20855 [Shouchella clausii]|uniref:TRAP transporter substrate-binding protein n=1 Tax=Shouchella clausii TaxID=79880 RepID=A0A268RZW5_SHOCL|nr:TRAP transporter substrate-binding protein [Shouchella clausii]PAD41705.1 hypothetical protein CHH54_16065 [Bacillus sp. 7520-S]MBU8598698.1 TRAP transporter substrate-binding protein [Shouchella clausii]MCY1106518.1 TRAP transporter substrate-binding protein [Shouchella clausii]PAD07256.1 hypothetical protein CHH76_20825 [Shouchella clausii]PAE78450.1 hypothetical protein CHH78_20855 [Shouchella clausii]
MRMKLLAIIYCSLFVFWGCSTIPTNESASNEVYSFRLGHTGNSNHHYHEITEEFANRVAERTDGNVVIEVFPANQLGNQAEAVEGVMIGTQDMVLTSGGILSMWVPDMGILNLPYLFDDFAHVHKALNSAPGKELEKQLREHDARLLGWWVNGFRHISNSKIEIKKPGDLEGLTIRTPETEVFTTSFEYLGAYPTAIAFNELYTALQLGTVEAQENPVAHIVTQRFSEVHSYVSKSSHMYEPAPLLINNKKFESLPQQYQTILVNTAKELELEHMQLVSELEERQWEQLEEEGMVISEVDLDAFRESALPIHEHYRKKLNQQLIDDIIKMGSE